LYTFDRGYASGEVHASLSYLNAFSVFSINPFFFTTLSKYIFRSNLYKMLVPEQKQCDYFIHVRLSVRLLPKEKKKAGAFAFNNR
jgi:hypothetical protein